MVDLKSCDNFVGYMVVYCVCFGIVIFYFVFFGVVFGVKSVEEVWGCIYNGFWYIKFLFLIG